MAEVCIIGLISEMISEENILVDSNYVFVILLNTLIGFKVSSEPYILVCSRDTACFKRSPFPFIYVIVAIVSKVHCPQTYHKEQAK